MKKPFSLEKDSRVCFKMAAEKGEESGRLSRGVCNNVRVHESCFEEKEVAKENPKNDCESQITAAEPLIKYRDDSFITVTWKKMEGALLYAILREE